ncbi:MAG: methionyl-tRNA formyltransferase [Bacilli bacterium]|nr:methionyl-tRNA formyltransferase [Bacilli bacterium]
MRYEKPNDVNVLFLGTPEIAAKSLKAIIEEGYNVLGVVTQEDKPTGRNKTLEMSPCKKVAISYGIPVYQPHRIRKDFDFAREMNIDVIVCMAYGQIVPHEFLALSKTGAINLHGSLLPEYRGAAPIQRSIIDGKEKTGITLMEMVDEMDAGTMYDKVECVITSIDNYTTLNEKLGDLAAELIKKDLLPYVNGELKGEEQNPELVTFAAKILPNDEKIDINLDSKNIVNLLRGLSLTPGGYFMFEGKKLKVFSAHMFSNEILGEVGEIIPNKKLLLVQLKDGILSLDSVQYEGKKKMDGASFKNGAHLQPHARLE